MAYGANGQIMSATEARGRNSNSIMANWVDRSPWRYWDTSFFAAQTALPQQINFFAIPIDGQNTSGVAGITANLPKTKFMTNMRDNHKLTPPECLLVRRIGIEFSAGFLKPDINAFVNSYWMEMKIDTKVFYEGWLWDFSQAGGLYGVTENAGESSWMNGLPSVKYQRDFGDWGRYIAPDQFFSVTFFLGLTSGQTIPTIGGTTAQNYPGEIRVVLDGLTDKSVQ